MATLAFEDFLVSSSNLISIAGGNGGAMKHYNIGMKKSSIDGNRYLYYL
jgi:hypothetical protein